MFSPVSPVTVSTYSTLSGMLVPESGAEQEMPPRAAVAPRHCPPGQLYSITVTPL